MRSIRFSCAMDTAWKIFQRFPSLITSLLFMEEIDLVRPQVPWVTQKGSKELELRNWLET
jgi:hypothetical protein